MTRNEAQFYVLVRAKGADGVEFLQARKTKPETGLLRNLGDGERWLTLRAYVPRSILLGVAARHDPVGVWGEPL